MSLPPIVIDTTLVLASSRLNCGGFGPSGLTFCGFSMWVVVAPRAGRVADGPLADRGRGEPADSCSMT